MANAVVKTVRVTIQGIPGSPLKMNPMPRQKVIDLYYKTKEVRNTDKPIEEVAKENLYDPTEYDAAEGLNGIPRVNLFACLCVAGRQISFSGKTKISTATSTFLPMIVSFEEGVRFFPFENQEAPWTTDVVRGRNPNGGEAVAIIRPAFEDWKITLKIKIDESTGVTDRTIFKLFRLAGKGIGICDHRPGCRGEAGMFKVVAWDTIDERPADDDESQFFDKGPRKKVTRKDQILSEVEQEAGELVTA